MEDLSKDKKYVLACSFGPDSMALFAMLCKEGYSFVVAHVNYHKRDVSDYEQQSLTEYCNERNIPIEVLSAPHCPEKANFQEWARELRYIFFEDVLNKYGCDAVLTAHQQDDLLETYLMQKQRGSAVNFYGIRQVTFMYGAKVVRPLLCFTKKELQEYDDGNGIPYSIDCSNLTDDYTRNRIRHHVIEKLTKEDRVSLLNEINAANSLNSDFDINPYIDNGSLAVSKLKELPNEKFILAIHEYLNAEGYHIELTKWFIGELRKALDSSKPSFRMKSSGLEFVKEYDELYVRKPGGTTDYSYSVESPKYLKTDEFEIDLAGDTSDRNVAADDYPLMIRNARKGDECLIGVNKVSLRRAFIDWKMPPSLRNRWPVIVNKDNIIIYVPRYRKDFADTHKTMFKINVKVLRNQQ